jgi:hypothetical protein
VHRRSEFGATTQPVNRVRIGPSTLVVIDGAGMADTVSPTPTRTSSSNGGGRQGTSAHDPLPHRGRWELGLDAYSGTAHQSDRPGGCWSICDRPTGKVFIGLTLQYLLRC